MYFIEIKNRLTLSLITLVTCVLINYLYLDNLLYITIKPCLLLYDKYFYFIFTDISEPFYTNLKLILYTSSQIFYLGLYYQFIIFLKPGLYDSEYKYIKYFNLYSFILFIIYFKTCYSLMIPWSFFFFFTHNNLQKIDLFFEAKMNEYLQIVFSAYEISIICSILCVLFSALVMRNNLKYITTQYRKYLYMIILSVASIITPPDVFSQIIITVMAISIFEIINYITYIYIKLIELRKPIEADK